MKIRSSNKTPRMKRKSGIENPYLTIESTNETPCMNRKSGIETPCMKRKSVVEIRCMKIKSNNETPCTKRKSGIETPIRSESRVLKPLYEEKVGCSNPLPCVDGPFAVETLYIRRENQV